MRRVSHQPRPHAQASHQALNFTWHAGYWVEDAHYLFTTAEIDRIETATRTLIEMTFSAVDEVIRRLDFQRYGIPEYLHGPIMRSWEVDAPTLYGRFDYAYDGEQLKLLEYNAQTPTSLYEAAVVQWGWLNETYPGHDQFNRIHEALLEQFTYLREQRGLSAMHFACAPEAEEDVGTTRYLQDLAVQAGLHTTFLTLAELGLQDGTTLVDLDDEIITALFWLHPYEFMWEEKSALLLPYLPPQTTVLEPLWKMILSNKQLLVTLWEMFPEHELLLPASNTPLSGPSARKSRVSREGQNVTLFDASGRVLASTDGEYPDDQPVYQGLATLPGMPTSDGQVRYPVLGAWVVGDAAPGIGIRESAGLITDNRSFFVPHRIE
ncbi:glutathionylspermidine synthase family protein [Deinococcus multiflagellatus]|uniref:Glutathionylspermidine synthase family protein n=1 Tax=Deinococcus multiflagellatus TaxID=1656887 RepID=A0ABW1ZQ07_9DEIO|nr:glutathionylspermidine synthase family protein [Deinococcus multiflagellatus]MBZ9715638.1 glutathionylspermidine synthase family protein [Deinococcus multiflagellatus]